MPHQADSRSRSDSWPPVQVRIAPHSHASVSSDSAHAAAPPVVTTTHAKPITSPPPSISLAAPAHDEDTLLIDASDNPLQFFLDAADTPISTPRIIQDASPTPPAAELDTEFLFDAGIEEPSPSLPRPPRAKSPHPNFLSSSPTTTRRGATAARNVYSSSEEDSEDSDYSADSRPRSRQQTRLHPAVEAMYDNSSDGEDYERLDAISGGKGYAALHLSSPPLTLPHNSYPPSNIGNRPSIPPRLGSSPPPSMPYRHSGLRNEYQGASSNTLLVPAAKGLQPTAHRRGRSLRAYQKRGAVAHSGKWKAAARPPSPRPRQDEIYSIAEQPAEEAAAQQQEFGSSVGSLRSVGSWGSGGSGGVARGRSPVPGRVGSPASFMSAGSTGSSGGYSAAGEEAIGMPMVRFAGERDEQEDEDVVQVVRRGEGGGRRVRFVLPVRE